MGYNLSEQKVLKKLGIPDFRHLTKGKVIAMASLLDKMDPEVAKKALDQFPDFAKTTKEMLLGYKDTLEKTMDSNSESVKAYYDSCNTRIVALQQMLSDEALSFEQKKYIIEEMANISKEIGGKDSENKKFLATLAAIGGFVAVASIGILAAVLGGNTTIKSADADEEELSDEIEELDND